MSNKIPEEKILYAKTLVERGNTLKFAAEQIDVSPDVLSLKLRALGVVISKKNRRPHNFMEIDVREIVRRYENGESVLSLARKFGVSRGVITKRLKEADIELRNSSQAMYLRMARTSFEERRALSANARKAHIDNIMKNAEHYSRGPGEFEIADALKKLGLEVIEQVPFNNGCVDMTVNGVIVEIKLSTNGGAFNFTRKRVKELIESRKQFIFIGFNHADCISERLEEIVALTQFATLHPTALGKYWMITCRRYEIPGSVNFYDTTIKLCSENPL